MGVVGKIRVCGLHVSQDVDYNISVGAGDNIKKIRPTKFRKDAPSTSEATPGKIGQMMVVGVDRATSEG